MFTIGSHALFYFQDSGHEVISHIKVLPLGECTRSVCPARIQQCLPFLIYITFVLVSAVCQAVHLVIGRIVHMTGTLGASRPTHDAGQSVHWSLSIDPWAISGVLQRLT